MQLGMIGLGRMGGAMAERLMRAGHELFVFDRDAVLMEELVKKGAVRAQSATDLLAKMAGPRAVWLMVPAAVVDDLIAELTPSLAPGDVVIDGGNSNHEDDIRRAAVLAQKGVHYMDVGVSGGIWGAKRGYCLMVGGDVASVTRLTPVFEALAPGVEAAPRTQGHDGTEATGSTTTAERGWLHCGPYGAGHFVKMIHNGIEYGMMAAFAEGFAVLERAGIGAHPRAKDAETSPLRNPEHYVYDFPLPEIAELWRRGSVVSSWLLDLTASALRKDGGLSNFKGRVSDSGEGRWTVKAAIDIGVPVPVLSASLFERFSSRGEGEYAMKILSAMRSEFGGHAEKVAAVGPGDVLRGENPAASDARARAVRHEVAREGGRP